MAATESNVLKIGAESGELNYYLIAGPQPFDIANTYSRLTGFNPMLPRWSLGYQHSRYGWQSADEILNIANQLRVQDFPTDSLWFDIDYMNNQGKFSWNPLGYPDPVALHNSLHQQGFKNIYIDEPCVRTDDSLWSYLDAAHHFATGPDGSSLVNSIWFGDVSWIDFTSSSTRTWYKAQLGTFLSTGIDGLWNDLNEPANNFMPEAIFNFDGNPRKEPETRNLYALLVNQTAYEAQLQLRPNVRPWNFSRSGYSGIQRYAVTWSGDANSTYDALRTNIQMTVSMGLSGQNNFGHDTGGFLGSPDAELFTRWLEFSLFTPLFRNHSVNTAAPREPWTYGEPYTTTIRNLIKWRYRLSPYLYTLFEEASRTGRPVVTPTFFYAIGDTDTYGQDTEYLLGPNLLVAPVHTPGVSKKKVYLPRGSQWVNYYTDTVTDGGQSVTVDAPLGKPPLFTRLGTILVQGKVGAYMEDPNKNPDLNVDFFPRSQDNFTLYEDDGESFDYKKGALLRTQISSNVTASSISLTITRLEGNYSPPTRNYWLRVHLVPGKPGLIQLNGSPIPEAPDFASLDGMSSGWYWDGPKSQLNIKTADQPVISIEIV